MIEHISQFILEICIPVLSIYLSIKLLKYVKLYRKAEEGNTNLTNELEYLRNQNKKLTKQHRKNKDFLQSLHSDETYSAIKTKRKVQTRRYDRVTVLFADIQGFTKIAEELNPEYLIDELDNIFFYFDLIAEKYNIEKIKTIGDAYMCAGGIPENKRTNPIEVILAALEMQHYLDKMHKEHSEQNTKIWDLRIGIHTGSIIAGAIGKKKISYDIWGDTVNIASRMEASGAIGKVNISVDTYEFVKDFFVCTHRGKMPVKYKGDIDMYFVEGIKPQLASDRKAITPNKKFNIKFALVAFQDIKEAIIKQYNNILPEEMCFHNSEHTLRMLKRSEILALGEELTEEDILILKTAVLFLNYGYLFDYKNHIDKAVEEIRVLLPEYDYLYYQIEEICNLIKSLKQSDQKNDLKEKLIYDIYYEYFGASDFIELSYKLFNEESHYKGNQKLLHWWQKQIKNVENHEFLTNTAKQLRDVNSDIQIKKIQSQIDKLKYSRE